MSQDDTPAAPGVITSLLRAAEGGNREALDTLFAQVYEELLRLARRSLRAGPRTPTLSTTALVHETFLKLSRGQRWSARDRGHFYATAARAMRFVLIDYARRRGRAKRDLGRSMVSLEESQVGRIGSPEELLAVDQALVRLEAEDPELARIVSWRFFAGLSTEEIAELLEVSERTVKRHWRVARAFLYRQLTIPGTVS
jgi:RNA polymerase sigma factor (TIGR02999 family)